MTLVVAESSARFSKCRCYRYSLTRRWADGPAVVFIGLNPSTADEHADDPTIRRCIGFAKRWGYGKLIVANLYAWRATNPRELFDKERVPGPVGEFGGVPGWGYGPGNFNDYWLEEIARNGADLIVAAWGANPGPISWRPERVLEIVGDCHALGLTKHGSPRHPLYVRADAQLVPFPGGAQ